MCNTCLHYCSQFRIWSLPWILYICMRTRFLDEWQVSGIHLECIYTVDSLHITQNAWCFLAVVVWQSPARTNSTAVPYSQWSPAPCQTSPALMAIILWFMKCTVSLISFMFLVLDLSLLFVSDFNLKMSYLLLVDLLTAMPLLRHVMFLIPK